MPKVCFALLLLLAPALFAQFPNFPQPQGDRVSAEDAINRALKTSSLTTGGKPFHAVLAIGVAPSPYSGQLEVWRAEPQKYKLVLTSRAFSQTRIVNGAEVSEANTGDYYPRWLQNFVDAILNPIPVADNFRSKNAAVLLGPTITRACLQRNDRPGGITDQMTWGNLCFAGSEPRIQSILTMNVSIEFSDWKKFNGKQIARTYSTDVLDYKEIVAHLTVLEDLKNPAPDLFAIATPTPPAQQIKTAFISTLAEESMVETVPQITWPTVREGKTDGYMIVYARTDRTGQVRETAKHNSDQPGLETFGMQQALRYKFKPYLVDGVAVQTEMPLVLHFTTTVADPLPILHGQELLNQISGCNAKLVTTPPSNATPTSISVNEQGKLTGEGFGPQVNAGNPAVLVTIPNGMPHALGLDCHFAPLIRNGVVTYYHGELLVVH